jgi:hypothetical protein
MQISGVSLALTWPHRLCLLRVPLCTAFATNFLRPACLFTVHMGSGSSPLFCGVFLPPPLSQAFPLLVNGRTPLLLQEPLWPTWLIYSSGKDSLPPNLALSEPHPLSHVSLLFLIILLSFSFYPGWRSVCPGGYAALAQGCL